MFESAIRFEEKLERILEKAQDSIGWDKLKVEIQLAEDNTITIQIDSDQIDEGPIREALGFSKVHSALFQRFPELKDPNNWDLSDKSKMQDLIQIERKTHAVLAVLGHLVEEIGDAESMILRVDASFIHDSNVYWDPGTVNEVQSKVYDSYLTIIDKLFPELYDIPSIYERYKLPADKISEQRRNRPIFWSEVYSLPGRFVGEENGRSQNVYWTYLTREEWAKLRGDKVGGLSQVQRMEIFPIPFFTYTQEEVLKVAKIRGNMKLVKGFLEENSSGEELEEVKVVQPRLLGSADIPNSLEVSDAVGRLLEDYSGSAQLCFQMIQTLREEKKGAKKQNSSFPEITDENFFERLSQFGALLSILNAQSGTTHKHKQCKDFAQASVNSYKEQLGLYLLRTEELQQKQTLVNWIAEQDEKVKLFDLIDPTDLLIEASCDQNVDLYGGFDGVRAAFNPQTELELAYMIARDHIGVSIGIIQANETSQVRLPLTREQTFRLLYEFSLLALAEEMSNRGLIPSLSEEVLDLRRKSKTLRNIIDKLPESAEERKLVNRSLSHLRETLLGMIEKRVVEQNRER